MHVDDGRTRFGAEVDRLFRRLYGIGWNDACGEEEPLDAAFADGETPKGFVYWWGAKYGLERVDLTPWGRLKQP